MAKYLLNRIMQTIALLLIVSLLSFFLVSLMPSDPVYAQFGTDITQEEYQVAFVRMGLDKPIIVRYLTWLGNVVKGDFGTSYCYHKGVWEVISGKLGTTLYMAVLSLLLSMPIGILLGTVTAVKRGQWADTIITLFSNLLIAIPQFVTAILFLYYISMKWKLLPPQGFTWPWVDFHKHIQQLIMPLTCLTLCGIAGFCRQTRSSVLEVLGQDYVRTARAKGLKETRILWKHVMNNGLIPILTMIGGRLASLIGGSIFVENVFNIPGMGNLMVKAVNTMDSMLGYVEPPYKNIGLVPAKADDVLNFIPARLSALFLLAAGAILGLDAKNGWRIFRRDRYRHASPNSAQTESVCAGLLGLRLAGDAWYHGVLHKKPYIGDERRAIEPDDIPRACRLMTAAAILALLACAGVKALCIFLCNR